jgi:hypothetical protein
MAIVPVASKVNVPAEIVVAPEYVLTPDKVNVPEPAFVKLMAPEITPVIELELEFVTLNTALSAREIEPAVKTPVVIVRPFNATPVTLVLFSISIVLPDIFTEILPEAFEGATRIFDTLKSLLNVIVLELPEPLTL